MKYMINTILIIISIVFLQDNKTESIKILHEAYKFYDKEDYVNAEKYFEIAYNKNNELVRAAYMIGLINLYNFNNNYDKALTYFKKVESDPINTIDKNNIFNGIGLCYLYIAIDKKISRNAFENERFQAEQYFNKALNYRKNDITFNNLGLALIESENIDKIRDGRDNFDNAIKIKIKPEYIHNKAIAIERLAHYYSGLVESEKRDYTYLKKSYEFFIDAHNLYELNKAYLKSQQRAVLVKEIYLSRKVYDQFRDKN